MVPSLDPVDFEESQGKEFVLVVDLFCTSTSRNVENRSQFNGITGAGFFAHAAVDAPHHVDVEESGSLFSIIPGCFHGNDLNAVGRTSRRAHEASHAFLTTQLVSLETMLSTVTRVWSPLLIGIMNRVRFISKDVLERIDQPLGHGHGVGRLLPWFGGCSFTF
jgi:hypothetical protein